MKNKDIFKEVALMKNKEFNVEQFKQYNPTLFNIIMLSMKRAVDHVQKEADHDYKIMNDYALSLERKLGIESNSKN